MDTIRIKSENQFRFLGQLMYESSAGKVLGGAGVRLYQGLDSQERKRQFLCVEDADTGEEVWYRIEGACLEPVSLEGMEHLPRNPR
jgi:hypothetical protein